MSPLLPRPDHCASADRPFLPPQVGVTSWGTVRTPCFPGLRPVPCLDRSGTPGPLVLIWLPVIGVHCSPNGWRLIHECLSLLPQESALLPLESSLVTRQGPARHLTSAETRSEAAHLCGFDPTMSATRGLVSLPGTCVTRGVLPGVPRGAGALFPGSSGLRPWLLPQTSREGGPEDWRRWLCSGCWKEEHQTRDGDQREEPQAQVPGWRRCGR